MEHLTRIVDLPKGGGANRGADVWFELVTEDGAKQGLCLDMGLFTPFLAGLDRFAAEAEKLRDPSKAAPVKAFGLEGVSCHPAGNGGLILRFRTAKAGSFDFLAPPEMIKPLLMAILQGLSQKAG